MPEFNESLKGRVAIVTGATSGIGKSLATLLVKSGVKCIIVGRRKERLKQLEDELGENNCFSLTLDLTEPHAALTVLNSQPAHWPKASILINNTGLALNGEPADKCLLSDWQTMINTNVVSLVNLTHALLPQMKECQRADVINMS